MSWERKAIPEFALHWNGNVLVRGFASDPVNTGNGDYLGELDYLVSCLAKANNMYLILAWRSKKIEGVHPSMPDDDAKRALSILAARYQDQSHVMYALQVEPHDVDWATLRPLFEDMVDAIRGAAGHGDKNLPLVMIPGTNWSRDVSHAINDPVKRHNVVYKTHPYGHANACEARAKFQDWFGKAHEAGLPVFVGEFGLVPTDDPNVCMTRDDINELFAFTRKGPNPIGWAAWILDMREDAQGNVNPGLEHEALMKSFNDLSPTEPFGQDVKKELGTPILHRAHRPSTRDRRPSH